MTTLSKFERSSKFLPSMYHVGSNRMITALVGAWCNSDETALLNIQETKEQLLIKLASGQYLDLLGSGLGVERPTTVSLSDNQYRDYLLHAAYDPKTVRTLIYQILEVFWGITACHSNIVSTAASTYDFSDGPFYLETVADNNESVVVTLSPTDFAIPTAVTAQEIIDKLNEILGEKITAELVEDIAGGSQFVQLYTNTPGLSGSIQIKDTLSQSLTPAEFTGTGLNDAVAGGSYTGLTHCTYTVTIDGIGPDTFAWTDGTVVVPGVAITGADQILNNGVTIRFGATLGHTLGDHWDFDALPNANLILAFPTNKQQSVDVTVVEIYPKHIIIKIPAELYIEFHLKGSHHFHPDSTIEDPRPSPIDSAHPFWPGSFLYDHTGVGMHTIGYSITSSSCLTTSDIYEGTVLTSVDVDNCLNFPNSAGRIMMGYGTNNMEIVNYTGRVSSFMLGLDPSHTFEHNWPSGSEIRLLEEQWDPRSFGEDYPIYFVDTEVGERLINSFIDIIKAAGVILELEVARTRYLYDGTGLPWYDYTGGGTAGGESWFQPPLMNNTEEAAMVAGFVAADSGKIWYNTQTDQLMMWNGITTVILG